MDKSVDVKNSEKETRKKKTIDFKALSIVSLVLGLVIGVVLIAFGTGKLIGYQNEMGIKTVDELSKEIRDLTEKYSDKEDERDEEFESNGFSEKYTQLDNEADAIDEEITKLTNSRYMREEGWHNPRNIGEAVSDAPEIVVGAVVMIIGVIGFFVLQRADKNKK